MEPKTDRELLSIMNIKLTYLCKELKEFKDTALSDAGFNRCAARGVELTNLKEGFATYKKVAAVAAIVAVVCALFAAPEAIARVWPLIVKLM